MCFHMVANSCRGSPRVFHGILNRKEFYSQYPVFDGTGGISRYSKFDLSVSIWLHEGIAIPLNTIKYHQILPNTIWELGFIKVGTNGSWHLPVLLTKTIPSQEHAKISNSQVLELHAKKKKKRKYRKAALYHCHTLVSYSCVENVVFCSASPGCSGLSITK